MAAKVIPELTDEQRKEAFRRSLELRRKRAELKSNIEVGGVPFLLFYWTSEDCIKGMKVYDLLMALPGIGTRKALALLQQAGIPSHNTVRACGPKQTERLFALLDK